MSQWGHAVTVWTVMQLSSLPSSHQLHWYVIIWRSAIWAQHAMEYVVAVREAADLPTAWSGASDGWECREWGHFPLASFLQLDIGRSPS